MNLATRDERVLASAFLRPRCSGSVKIRSTPNRVPSKVRVPTVGYAFPRALPFVLLGALVVLPTVAVAAPAVGPDHVALQARQSSNNGNSTSNGSISMNVWLPILLLTIVFALFCFCACIRRCATGDAAARTTSNGTGPNAANGNAANATRPRRRPRRTPSQISTKSLPPYMKEPGDLELVLFRGPAEGEDDQTLPHGMPVLAEDDEDHPEMQGATYDVALDRMESLDTMADSSTTNLIRRPPALHHAPALHSHRRSGDAHSLDSVGSEAELLAAHQRAISVDNPADSRGAAPSYTEAVPAGGGMTTISLNDPQPNTVSPDAVAPPGNMANVTGRARSRFSFLLHNPFSSHQDASATAATAAVQHTPSESSAQHVRSGSALSRISSHESHDSHYSRTQSNGPISHSHSNSALFRAFRSHSPGMHAGSSTISLDSISAPLTHTVKRAEFRAPKGGLLTADQIKLITSREGLERFGRPYGADAVAAFSRERLADMVPPPDFDAVAGEHEEEPSANDATEGAGQPSDGPEPTDAQGGSGSLSPALPSSQADGRADSRASSYATAEESEDGRAAAPAQTVEVVEGETEREEADDPRTARPTTPTTARPSRISLSKQT